MKLLLGEIRNKLNLLACKPTKSTNLPKIIELNHFKLQVCTFLSLIH